MRNLLRNNGPRWAVHSLLGVAYVAALLLFPKLYLAIAGTALVFASFAFEFARLRVNRLQRWLNNRLSCFLRPEEGRIVTGATYLLAGATVTVILFPRNIAALAILYLAFGDPIAALVGKSMGKTKLWGRTLQGHLACLASCVILAAMMILLLHEPSLPAAALGVVSATLFQALPWRINDNLTIPIGSASAMLATEAILRSSAVMN